MKRSELVHFLVIEHKEKESWRDSYQVISRGFLRCQEEIEDLKAFARNHQEKLDLAQRKVNDLLSVSLFSPFVCFVLFVWLLASLV
jgi:predicted transcriptional regulator